MSRGLNKAHLIGHVGRDPESRSTPGGLQVTNFSLATTDTWAGQDGKKQERTEWHRIVLWGKLAELAGQYVSKGQQLYIEGRIQSREWEDKSGQKRQTTEIVANQMLFLGAGKAQDARPHHVPQDSGTQDRITERQDPQLSPVLEDEDLPF